VYLAEMALSVLRALKPVPPPTEARLLEILAAANFASHDHERAIATYKEAIAVGSAVSDLQGLARLYGALGADYRSAGDAETAARHTRRPLAVPGVLRDRDVFAKCENDLPLVVIADGER